VTAPAGAPPLYLTAPEVAELLRVSTKSVYRLAADPSMPVLRLGGRGGALRFPRIGLEAWLRAREQGAGRPRRGAGRRGGAP